MVTPTGQLQARKAGTGIRVIADLTAPGNVRHSDSTVWSYSFVFHTALLKTSFVPVDPWVWATATDGGGQEIAGIPIANRSLDSAVARVYDRDGDVELYRPGSVRITAEATAYGVTKADTVVFTVTWPVVQVVNTLAFYFPPKSCGPGNVMLRALPPDDSVPPGQIKPDYYAAIQVRQFPVPGVYRYHSVRTGATGQIVVTTDPDPAALP